MNQRLAAALGIIALFIIVGAVAALTTQQPPASVQHPSLTPTPSVIPAAVEAQSSLDTANPIYISNTYKTDSVLPLNTWQPITVYGETFPACVVGHEGAQTVLTVDPQESQICEDLSLSPKGE